MILLESRSRIIEEHLFLCSSSSAHGDDDSNNNNDGGINTQTIPPSSPKNSFSKGFEVTFIDFGDCKYRLHNNGRSNVICLSMAFPSFNELKAKGLLEHLISIYKEYSVKVEEVVQSPSSPFYQLMFSLSKESLSTAAIRELSLIRRNCLAFPLLLAMNSGEKAGLIRVALRDSGNDDASSSTATATDAMYVKGCKDRVVVVLQTKFDDPSDHVLSRTFLQEFFDVRRQNSNLSNTPQILSSKEAPEDIKAVLVCDNSNNSSNNNNNNESHYITFILFPSHYEVGEKREKCLNTIINFRDYFHYHLKCCKSFLHTRMRGKVADFLKILNRSKNLQ